MKKDVLITIKSMQQVEEEHDEIELTTIGTYYFKDGKHYLIYQESEATGFDAHTTTTVKVEGEQRITMTRSGPQRSQLIMERGKHHLCHYSTNYGDLMIGVLTDHISADFSENKGEVSFRYTLDVNSTLASENQVFIKVKECNKSHE